MTIRLSRVRVRGGMAALIGVILLLTGVIQFYAQGRTATASPILPVPPAQLLQHQNGSAVPPTSGGHASASNPAAASTSGALQVTAYVQASIQLVARSAEAGEQVAGGHEEATVTIPIPLDGADSAGGSGTEIFPLATVSRIASLAKSDGYTLEATWTGSQECAVTIDGLAVASGKKTDITQTKVMGDPYGTETAHTVRVTHPSAQSGCPGGVLVLTARPKMR